MSVPIPGQPQRPDVTFDLGLDALVRPADFDAMDDPWTPTDAALPDPREPEPMSMPTPGLAPWADNLQIPGF